jgi:type II secretory pathway pseudopilin PulG
MTTRRIHAATLIEAMVAMGVMTIFLAVAVSTSQRSMTLQKRMESQADAVVDACRLAERLRIDCGDADRVTLGADRSFELVRDGAAIARYAVDGNMVRRTVDGVEGNASTVIPYRVNIRAVTLWDPAQHAWSDSATESGAVRLQLDRAHLVATCGRMP